MAKRERWELQQMQSLPLELKIRKSQERIKEWYEYWDGMVYISYSGGKDSTVLKHLVQSMYPDVPAVFVDTGLEYPEVRKMAIKNSDIQLRPKMNFKQVLTTYGYPIISKEISDIIDGARKCIKDIWDGHRPRYSYYYRRIKGLGEYSNKDVTHHGYSWEEQQVLSKGFPSSDRSTYNCSKYEYCLDLPFKISNKCCNEMKKKPFKQYEKNSGKVPYVGTMASESMRRYQVWVQTGCNAFNSVYKQSKPLSFWTDQDILQYIVKYNLEIPSVYGEIVNNNGHYDTTGCKRTGCVFCAYGAHLEEEPNRFQRLAKTHPKLYTYCIGGVTM